MKCEERGFKAILFDVGGVLAFAKNSIWKNGKFKPSGIHEYVTKILNIPMDQYMEAIERDYPLAIEGKIPNKKVLKIFAKNLSTSSKKLKKLYTEAYKKNFRTNKELLEKARELRSQGYKIAILSDQWFISKKEIITKEFYKIFNKIIVSCDVKMRKPNSEIYEFVIKKLRINPKETVFIDNQKWNLPPARKLGMKTILFKNNRQCFKELNKLLNLKS